jgi:hypothetical protein
MFITANVDICSLIKFLYVCKIQTTMENKRSQAKVAMNYGLLYGLAGIAITLLFYFLGIDMQSKIPMFVGFIALIIFIFTGVKSYRDEDLEGYISYGRSLGTGTLIALFGSIITAIFTVILFTYIAPELPEKILENAQQKFAEGGMSDDQVEQGLKMTRMFMSPVWLFLFSILTTVFWGFLFSLIISIFTKKEGNPFNSNIG